MTTCISWKTEGMKPNGNHLSSPCFIDVPIAFETISRVLQLSFIWDQNSTHHVKFGTKVASNRIYILLLDAPLPWSTSTDLVALHEMIYLPLDVIINYITLSSNERSRKLTLLFWVKQCKILARHMIGRT
jgi:hypothetical protein